MSNLSTLGFTGDLKHDKDVENFINGFIETRKLLKKAVADNQSAEELQEEFFKKQAKPVTDKLDTSTKIIEKRMKKSTKKIVSNIQNTGLEVAQLGVDINRLNIDIGRNLRLIYDVVEDSGEVLDEILEATKQTNEIIADVDDSINSVHRRLNVINGTLEDGFDKLESTTKEGFDDLYETINEGFDNIDETLDEGFDDIYNKLSRLQKSNKKHLDILHRSLDTLHENGIKSPELERLITELSTKSQEQIDQQRELLSNIRDEIRVTNANLQELIRINGDPEAIQELREKNQALLELLDQATSRNKLLSDDNEKLREDNEELREEAEANEDVMQTLLTTNERRKEEREGRQKAEQELQESKQEKEETELDRITDSLMSLLGEEGALLVLEDMATMPIKTKSINDGAENPTKKAKYYISNSNKLPELIRSDPQKLQIRVNPKKNEILQKKVYVMGTNLKLKNQIVNFLQNDEDQIFLRIKNQDIPITKGVLNSLTLPDKWIDPEIVTDTDKQAVKTILNFAGRSKPTQDINKLLENLPEQDPDEEFNSKFKVTGDGKGKANCQCVRDPCHCSGNGYIEKLHPNIKIKTSKKPKNSWNLKKKVVFINPNDKGALIKRLGVLTGSYNAGNTDNLELKNEISTIIDLLLNLKVLTKQNHQQIYNEYVRL